MTRPMILVIALAGAAGLGIGWAASRPGTGEAVQVRQALRPTPDSPPHATPADPARREFPLRREDVSNDRETPALAVDALGRVVLAWAAQSGENERTIHLARSADGGKTFGSPAAFRKVPIFRFASQSKGKAVSFSTHVLPRLVSTSEGLYLGWVEAVDGGPEVVEYVARSVDGGGTFEAPVKVHGKDAKKPGFTTLSAAPDGTLLAAWIDARNKTQQPYFAAKPAGSEGFEPDRMVFGGPDDKGICPCCDLAAARLPDGSDLVAFRNSDSGHRDVWFARAPRGGEFGPPSPLSSDRWKFEGCPHDGPSLALTADRLHAAWMSAHTGRNRVYVASSSSTELAFAPHELSPGSPGAQGHPKLIADGSGTVYAVWDETLDAAPEAKSAESGHKHGPVMTGSGRAVMLAASADGGFGTAVAVAAQPGAFQLNPAITAGPDGAVLIAWSEIDTDGKRVVFVRREPAKRDR